MNPKVAIPLDSFDLAQYAVQVPCYVCDGANTFDAELCRHCFAPMALAHQANCQKVRPRMVATVGATGAGKTVFLGMLMDMLSRQSSHLQLLARGAFSISLQRETMNALARCEFPTKTPSEPDRWNWVHCQIKAKNRRRPLEIIMPDLAGEAILEEAEHPHTFPAIRSLMVKCSAAMVLLDVAKVETGQQDQDFFAMKLLSYLSELAEERKRFDRSKGSGLPPVALVFTKADACDTCFDNPASYAQKQVPGLWKHCVERFDRHRFFAVSTAGAYAALSEPGVGRQSVPLRVEPRGIVAPFNWLVEQFK